MANPICPHLIPAHWGSFGPYSDRDVFAQWQPSFIKVITDDETVPYIDQYPADAKLIVRNYPLSENYHKRGFRAVRSVTTYFGIQEGSGRDTYHYNVPNKAMNADRFTLAYAEENPTTTGYAHADACNRIAQWCEGRGVPRSRLLFEGLNEPMLWSVEPPDLLAEYYYAFLKRLHEHNLHGVVGNFGVGWPGNSGIQDAPVQWNFFANAINIMQAGDYLGLHEYWALNGVDNTMNNQRSMWRWWAGRYEQCPYNVPILITECGIDTGVTGQFYGSWRRLPGNENQQIDRYIDELLWYWEKCLNDRRIKAIFPFTYDRGSATWFEFDIRHEGFIRRWLERKGGALPPVNTPPAPPPVPVTDIGNIMLALGEKEQVVRINPKAALLVTIGKNGLVATSNEFRYRHTDGKEYVGQRAESTTTGEVAVFYVEAGKWNKIMRKNRP